MTTSSIYRKVGIASAIMTASVFLSRIIGLVRESVIAHFGGTGMDVDAYQVAFVIPEILNHIAASGFLSITFIPIFSRYLVQNREDEGWRVFSVILSCCGALLIVFILLLEWFAPEIVALVAYGRPDPEFRETVTHMTRIIIPAQFCFFAGGMFMAVQFAKEKFFLPAVAPLIYNIGIITGGVVLSPWIGIKGFSWGVVGGAVAGNFFLQYLGAKRAGMKFRLTFDFRHPDLKKYIILTIPLMIGLTMTFSTEIFIRFFGAFLSVGSVAGLNYGLRIMQALAGFFGQAVGMAAYPFMARLAAEKNIEKMNELLNAILKYITLVIPFSVLFMVLRYEVVRVLFQRGAFDAGSTELTSGILLFLLIGAFAFAAQTVVSRGYYAVQETLFPALYGTVAVLVSIPVYVYSMRVMGVNGVALAVSVYSVFQVVLLYVLWNRRSRNTKSRSVYIFGLKVILLSIPLGIILEWFKGTALSGIGSNTFWGCLLTCIITGSLFMLLFTAAGYVFRIREILDVVNVLAKKFTKADSKPAL